jgi:hypothetical protein
MNARSATSSTCGSRTGTCTCHCWRRRTRSPAIRNTQLGIQAHIDSWIEQCPEGWGPNWVSPLELGIRLINWSITWQLLGGMRAKLFTSPDGAAFRERWLKVHLPARAHDRRQPVALLLGKQPPRR